MPAISPPPPIGTKIASSGAGILPQDLHADRALPGDHVGIVERVDQGQAALARDTERVLVGMIEIVAVQHDFAAETRARPAP